MKFKPGNEYAKMGGRPRGVRNRLAGKVFEDVLEFWNQPAKEGSALTKGKAALLNMWRERPHEFVKFVGSVMPKEFVFENIVTELADDELEQMISMMRSGLRRTRLSARKDTARCHSLILKNRSSRRRLSG